ncbi:MAG: glutamate--tRNA ligase [bacterium]|nr:glutamate--tRNA ligase [bacterium]
MKVKTRIAPSPTGYMHVGTARTALFNYLFAKQNHGEFLLRIEDTDIARSKPEYEVDITNGLEWLGLNWDGGIVRQSERIEIYKKYADKLVNSGKAQKVESEKGVAIIFTIPAYKEIIFKDEVLRASIGFKSSDPENIVLIKSDGNPAYNFAVVVDDHEMDITDVIRGQDHTSNTHKQVELIEALEFKRPRYAHLPLILATDRSKLSKRHGAVSVNEFTKLGYLPEAMLNFLALIGWHPKDNREIFNLDDLIKEFDISRVQISGAVFDNKKLDSINNHYIKNMVPAEIAKFIAPYLDMYDPNEAQLIKVAHLFRDRLNIFSEIKELAGFIFALPVYETDLLNWKESPKEKTKENLETVLAILENMPENSFDIDTTTTELMPKANDIGRGDLLWPLRVALSGLAKSPSPFEILDVLGKKESVRRIKLAIDKI